jgi:ribosomal protein S18 acetylase RimI-like enzyme
MIAIREADARDAEVVIALWRACELIRPWNDPEADFARALAFSGSTILIAEIDGEAVGTAMAGFDGHRGWVYYLAVAPRFRRQGIARRLLAACERWLVEQGCPKVELMVRDGNPDMELYNRLGWEAQPVHVFARWLDGSGE